MTTSKLEQLRAERNARLAASDFTMLPDYAEKAEGEIEALKLYRQALRDLPANYDGKKEVEWPVQPFTTQEA
jgi:hypothetical protein